MLFSLRLDSRSAEACDLLVGALQLFLGGALVERKELKVSREQVFAFHRCCVSSLSDTLRRLGLDLAPLALEEVLELESRRVCRLASQNTLSYPRARVTDVRARTSTIPCRWASCSRVAW